MLISNLLIYISFQGSIVFSVVALSFFVSSIISRKIRTFDILAGIFAIFTSASAFLSARVFYRIFVHSPVWFSRFGGIIFSLMALVLIIFKIFANIKNSRTSIILNIAIVFLLTLSFVAVFLLTVGV